ncbi:MAG: esterase, partial [Alphaproteobacteria bacterium]|nr:esterase [Alphaproteobacteria bacterium]
MSGFLRALIAALLLPCVAWAQAPQSKIVKDAFKSDALGAEYKMALYLPAAYDGAAGRLPVVYLLHGASGDEDDWVIKGSVQLTFDALIKRGELPPMVAVMPANGTSWWIDGAALKAETAFMRELVPFVEGKYKVANAKAQRAIGGLSMGGYGSLNLALRHPEKFCAAAVMSPAIYDPLPPATSAARRTPQFVRNGQFDEEIWKSRNYPAHLDAYKRGAARVPMWIMSGDH